MMSQLGTREAALATANVAVATVVDSASHFRDLVHELLPSWQQGALGAEADLFVVNNNCTEWDEGALPQSPAVTVIHQSEKQGYSSNLNAALEQTFGYEFFLAMNPDMRFAPGNLEAMIRYMSSRPQCGLGTCSLLSFEGGRQHNCRRWQNLRVALARRTSWFPGRDRIVRRYLMLDEAYDKEATPDWVSGCYMFFRRDLLAELGGFDDGFRLYFEDCDVARRVWNGGYSVNYTPDPVCYHREHRQSTSLLSWHGRTHLKSWLRYTAKRIGVFSERREPIGDYPRQPR